MQMITRVFLTVVLLAAGAGSAWADMKDDVAAAYKAWDAAFNSGDAKAVAAFYLPDGKVLPPTHKVVTGPAEIEKLFGGFITGGVKAHALEIIEVGGADKIIYGTANWSAKDKDGKQIGGIATHIFERQADGTLKLRIHTFN